MLHVLITGGELNNKGAQAMTFVTVDQIKRRYPDSQIRLLSPKDSERSKEEKENYRFEIISGGAGNAATIFYKLGGLFNVLKLTGKVTKRSIEAVDAIYGDADCIVDISGYGYGSNWGFLNSFRYIATRCVAAKAYHVDLYLMPQSFGPIDFKGIRGNAVRQLSKQYFPCAKRIYAREKDGFALLAKEYKLNNVFRGEDIVLANKKLELCNIFYDVPNYRQPEIPEKSVAIIPNDKNNKYGNKEQNLQMYKKIIEYLLKQKKNVFLLYHAGEDLKICMDLKNQYEEDSCVQVLKQEFACYEFDKLIGKFEYAVASRFHSVVHAYKNGTPCLIMGWSVKYHELAAKFGQQKYVIHVTGECSDRELIKKLQLLEEKAAEESAIILKKQTELCQVNLFDAIFGKQIIHVGDIDGRLCTSCGICAAVCPAKCISYSYVGGRYLPKVDEETCIQCSACKDVCSCWEDSAARLGVNREKTGYLGNVLQAAVACSKDMETLKNGTSGGVVTTVVEELLRSGMYDCAFLVDDFNYKDAVKTKKYVRGDVLLQTAKSRYIPVLHTDAVKYLLQNRDERVIIAAVPCAVHSFCLVINKYNLVRENILLLGLFCDKAENYQIFRYFEDATGKNIDKLYFREKDNNGWPGNVGIQFEDGEERILPRERRTEIKEVFQMERCLYCMDKLNLYCDIAFGDNYTGTSISEKQLGSNTLLIRTRKGGEIMEWMQPQLYVREITTEMVEESQHLSQRETNLKNAVLLKKKNKIDIYQTENPDVILNIRDSKNYEKLLADLQIGIDYDYKKIVKTVRNRKMKKNCVKVKRIPMRGFRLIKRAVRKALR